MRQLFKLVRNFFGFSRSQTNGFLLLLPLLVLIISSAPLYRWWKSHQKVDFSNDQHLADSLIAVWEKHNIDSTSFPATFELQAFNPNLATAEELQALGLEASVANRLVRYRSRGGKFLVKSDMLKVYGMDSIQYNRLRSYIQLPDQPNQKPTAAVSHFSKSQPRANVLRFDLNTADTTQLMKVYGIGEKLSLRIVKYRERLGGFISADQLYEVWGLDSVVISRVQETCFVAAEFTPRKLPVNKAREAEFATHPYLSKSAAKAIAAYRFQHGPFSSIADLERVQSLDAETIRKIAPYLAFQD